MIHNIYQTIYDKLPNALEDILPVYDRCKLVTCLNAFYMMKLKEEDYHWYEEFDFIPSDGMGPIKLNKLFGKPKSLRLSFDLSTMAGPVFRDMMAHGESLYVLAQSRARWISRLRPSRRSLRVSRLPVSIMVTSRTARTRC